jgi:hypothetical protein
MCDVHVGPLDVGIIVMGKVLIDFIPVQAGTSSEAEVRETL